MFKFSMDIKKDIRPVTFKIQDIEVIPADKSESFVIERKNFIVFNEFETKAYFINDYWDEAFLILDQLDIKMEGLSDRKLIFTNHNI